ncbi:MAG TPA: phosphatase PAP2 family protein [Usitatibacter sp.]|nr:phosphatase PAP2 family protein [Usitatibacter sp.]
MPDARAEPSAKLRELTLEDLPPYGFMPDIWQSVSQDTTPSPFWRGTPGEWRVFVENLLGLVTQHVWPTYTRGRGWDAVPARANAMALTTLELDVMQELHAARYRAAAWAGEGSTEEMLFNGEDDVLWDDSILRHCPGLAFLRDPIRRLYYEMNDRRQRSVVLALKWRLQRPRAALVAYMQGRPTWFWGTAKTAMSPSMISGHAMQGCLLGCVVFAYLNRHEKELAKKYREALQRWTMGIGDRRVLAGVHYPSDNIASWMVATRLVPALVHDAAVPEFLAEAIETASDIAAELRLVAGQSRGGPLQAPLAGLDAALSEMRGRAPSK